MENHEFLLHILYWLNNLVRSLIDYATKSTYTVVQVAYI
jgi:hypothetical protein